MMHIARARHRPVCHGRSLTISSIDVIKEPLERIAMLSLVWLTADSSDDPPQYLRLVDDRADDSRFVSNSEVTDSQTLNINRRCDEYLGIETKIKSDGGDTEIGG